MLIDAKKLENNSSIESEIIIIGGGIAGIAIALQLNQLGHETAILESGGLEPAYKTQKLYSGIATIGTEGTVSKNIDDYLLTSRLRYFGGSGNHWDGYCVPLDEVDFLERSWVPLSGWPFRIQQLLPYYSNACDYLKIPRLNNVFRLPTEYGYPKILVKPTENIAFRPHYFTKYSGDEVNGHFDEIKKKAIDNDQIKVYLNANVTLIDADENGKQIKGLKIQCLNGIQHCARGKVYILATGGIENVRLLLSSNNIFKSGIGNHSDMLGRCFQGHASIMAGNKSTMFLKNKQENKYVRKIRNRLIKKYKTSYILSTTKDAQQKLMTNNFSIYLGKNNSNNLVSDAIKTLLSNLSQSSTQPSDFMLFNAYYPIEHTPNINSRVSLNPNQTDALGMSRIQLNWQNQSLDFDTLEQSINLLVKELGMQNAGRVHWSINQNNASVKSSIIDEPSLDQLKKYKRASSNNLNKQAASSENTIVNNDKLPSLLEIDRNHHIGTTRMSTDPKYGVVDKNCKVHGLGNLYIAGSSVFPTSGIANPTLTILALSFRLGEYIHQNIKTDR